MSDMEAMKDEVIYRESRLLGMEQARAEKAERERDEALAEHSKCDLANEDALVKGEAKLTAIEALVEDWRAMPWDVASQAFKECADELEAVLKA